jgi:hypothetical protein
MSSSGGSSSPARRTGRFLAGRGRATHVSLGGAANASAALPTTSGTRRDGDGADSQGQPGLITGISGPSRHAERHMGRATRSAGTTGASAAAGAGAEAVEGATPAGQVLASDLLAPALAPDRVLAAGAPAFSLPNNAGATGDTGTLHPAAASGDNLAGASAGAS